MQIQAKTKDTFHRTLAAWYQSNGRHDLPWRTTRDPYAIYISEVMLQQTQVKTVLERFYFPFLKRFPTLQSLADAPQADVMKQWEGLGYYRRAGNLHKAAQQSAPILPDSVDGLLALSGIGQNTAHAVAAFAFQKPVPVLEANVKRVVARIFALSNPKPTEWWDAAWALLNHAAPFDYNQAMMDLGAIVCLPKSPRCGECPANNICQGKDSPESYPAKAARKAVPVRTRRIVVWQNHAGQWHLEPREGDFLGGLYGFAEYPESAETVSFRNTAYHLPHDGELLGKVAQTYSHFKLDAQVWRVVVGEQTGAGWFAPVDIQKLALSGADHKVVALLVT